ncbi:MAG: hypothetical protein WDN72_11210 [Alphaproteobacteria bacterium]
MPAKRSGSSRRSASTRTSCRPAKHERWPPTLEPKVWHGLFERLTSKRTADLVWNALEIPQGKDLGVTFGFALPHFNELSARTNVTRREWIAVEDVYSRLPESARRDPALTVLRRHLEKARWEFAPDQAMKIGRDPLEPMRYRPPSMPCLNP